MNSPFHNQVAIVTGGASGIGRALCEELARRGALAVVADINRDGAQAAASAIDAMGGRAVAAPLDVTCAVDVEHLVEDTVRQHGRLDYMFNNAGIGVAGEVRDLSLDHWRKTIDINLWGVIYGATAAYGVMLRQGSGHIVNIASAAGLIGEPGLAPYSVTKSAVVALSTALRSEAESMGVRVSVVCPGFVDTAIYDNAIGVKVDKDKFLPNCPCGWSPPRMRPARSCAASSATKPSSCFHSMPGCCGGSRASIRAPSPGSTAKCWPTSAPRGMRG